MGEMSTLANRPRVTPAANQVSNTLLPICNIVTPVGMLGYGLNEAHTSDALVQSIRNGAPTAIVLDSGSTDSGPEKLALGSMSAPRSSYVRDLTKLTRLANTFHVPLIFSSAGGDGSDEHVREMVKVLEEISGKGGNEHYHLKTIAIFSEVSKEFVRERRRAGVITGCGKPVPELTDSDIDSAPRIVSQMGPEPFYDAMMANPDFNVIIGGRAYDPSPYIAFAAYASQTPFKETRTPEAQALWGGFAHMGKIMECGGLCASPKSNGAIATVYHDGTFDISPLDPASRCTPLTVSAHTLYEKSRPDLLYGPGGWLDLTQSKYEQLDNDRTCRVRGGKFTFSRDAGLRYQVKLEAATVIGYRSSYMGSIKDPILIKQLDTLLIRIKEYVTKQHENANGTWDIDWHVYGQNNTTADGQPAEIFLMGEALASTQELATSVASTARIATVHAPYPHQKANSGNLAYGHGGKMESELGACAQFTIYHLTGLEEGEEHLNLTSSSNGLYHQSVTTIGVPATPQPILSKPVLQKQSISMMEVAVDEAKDQEPPRTLGDVAKVLRSKNAGPFEITFDVMFATPDIFNLIKAAGFLNTKAMASLFDLQEDDIIWSGFFDQALAYKATIPRLWRGKPASSGGFMENDVHGSQKYIGLLNMPLPEAFVEKWKEL